jgi:hypothetical protein
MTTFNDLVKTLGGVPISPGFPFSKDANYFFVDPANGSSSGTGAFDDPCDKVSTAFALCTANQHDTVIYIAGSSGCTETAVIDWNLNYTHLIGIAAPSRAGKRARIFQGASLASTPFITVSATGCIFKDLYIFSGVADAAALISVKVTGGRNYFENVHFAGGGHATSAVNGGYALALDGAEENLFVNCTIGVDTATQATGWFCLLLDTEATRNVFEDCIFTMKASNAGAGFVEGVDNACIDRYMIFKRCLFINSSATAVDTVFELPTGMAVPRGPIVLQDCAAYGADDWDDQDRGLVFTTAGTFTAGGNSGLLAAVAAA